MDENHKNCRLYKIFYIKREKQQLRYMRHLTLCRRVIVMIMLIRYLGMVHLLPVPKKQLEILKEL